MLCDVMFSILDALVLSVSEWCSTTKHWTPMKCFLWISFLLIVYLAILLLMKLTLWIYERSHDTTFLELYEAAEKNDMVKTIAILKSAPSYVNKFKYPEGYTPFMVACANANTQMVKFMLKMGADVFLKSKNDETAFYLATFYYIRNKNCKNASCIRELYYAGAKIDEPSKNNVTPLQLAAIFGHTSLIKWLLMKNASVTTCPHLYLLAKSQGHHEAANLIAASMRVKSIQFK